MRSRLSTRRNQEEGYGVSTLELFFDLVFVFAITQVSHLLLEHLDWRGALEAGLVNRVFEDHETLVEGTLEVAARIAAHSPLAIWGTKEAINYARDHSVADSLHQIAGWQSGMFVGSDMAEEFAAKAEGREPSFEDIPPRPA